MNNAIGPSLPPHLLQKKETKDDDPVKSDNSSTRNIGPALPPWLKKNDDPQEVGPSLPGHGKVEDRKVGSAEGIGPALPPWLSKQETSEIVAEKDEVKSYGPALPPGFQKATLDPERLDNIVSIVEEPDDDEPIIGPLPPSANNNNILTVAEEFEKRSKKMKDRLQGREEPKKVEREEWMLELPPLLQGFGTGPRKFRAREKHKIGDRSVWTETPADKARKAAQGKEAEVIPDDERINMEAWSKRDAEIAKKLSDQSGFERNESLMDMHEKARKRKLEEEGASGEENIRRPFDREVDLQTNKFDDAAKKRFIKKTQGLSSRFSTGSTSAKFL